MKLFKKTKIGSIPIEWDIEFLEELVKDGSKITYGVVQPGAEERNGIKFIRGGDIKGGEISKSLRTISSKVSEKYSRTLLSGGELLVSLVGYPGECAIVPASLKGANIARQVGIIRIKNGINKFYVQQYMSSSIGKRNLLGNLVGSAQQVINLNMLRKVQIPLPPLPEQQKIAEILSTVDEKIAVIDQQIIATEELKKGLMQRLLTKGIGHTEFKDSPLGKIPKSWGIIPIYDLRNKNDKYSFTGGPFGSDLKSEHYTNSGVKVIQLQNIGEGEFINKGLVFTSEEKADELKSCNIFPDDIILAKMAPVARSCKIPNTDSRYLMCSDGIRLSVDRDYFDNDFIFYAINSSYFLKSAEAQSTGTTRARIGLNDLKKLEIKIPEKLSEQKEIAEILSNVDTKLQNQKDKKQAYQQLKKGLMQQLLTGKIRVNKLIEA